ncbi:MAG: cellulase family glycosylhydrolase [Sphingobacteriales bacterium]|nr:cellulase family glycosylhydrolase [Sphingobacteriales bacterium]
MRTLRSYIFFGILFAVLAAVSCKKTDSTTSPLTLTNLTDTIPEGGGTVALSFSSNAAWSIDTTGAGWLHLSQTSGNPGGATISLSAAANASGISRTVLLSLNSTNGQSRRITVLQLPRIFPSYNTSAIAADASGMSSTAAQLVAQMKLGWNLGNTLEAPGGETGWGNPVVTQALIDLVKSSGFNAIRIPCAWNSHADQTTAAIDTAWLRRVKEVVQYCINDGVYVLLNDHVNDGWLDCTATGAKLDIIKAKQKAYWEQIATEMRDFDEHLILGSANEPNATDLPSSTVLRDYHQIFINAVRSTGGKNANRTLVIQAPSTSVDLADYFIGIPGMPVDQVPKKLVMEVHWYSPPNFAILSADASWGKEWCYWGANYHSKDDSARNATPNTEESYVDSTWAYMKRRFVDNNIPVLIGEYGVPRHNATLTGHPQDSILSLNSRAHFYKYVTQSAKKNGIPPFIWDAYYDLIDRHNNVVYDPQLLDSLKAGAGL